MNQRLEEKFLDYLEGTLSEAQRLELEDALEQDPALRESLEDYQAVMGVESVLAGESAKAHPSFSAKVMQFIEADNAPAQEGLMRRFAMLLQQHRRMIAGSLATFATLVIVIRLSYDTSLYSARSKVMPVSPLAEYNREARDAYQSGVSAPESAARNEVVAAPVVPQGAVIGGAAEKKESSLDLKQQPLRDQSRMLEKSKRVDAPSVPQAKRDRAADESSYERTAKTFSKLSDRLQEQEMTLPLPGSSAGSRQLAARSNLSEGAAKVGIASADLDSSWGRVYAPTEQSGEAYNNTLENGRILVKTEPVSTFSIDVDTASYANVRRYIRSGQLPPLDAVRIEELINYFDYQYPVQYERPFTLSYEVAPSPLDRSRHLLKLGIKARDVEPNSKGWNLVFLVDVSGSMSDSAKLPLLKRALPVLVDRMRPEDRISIVTYAGNAGVALESTKGSEKDRILNAIDNLSSGGSTNGAGGIRMAYEIARRNQIEGGVNRVILATDGDFNVGLTSQQELIRMIEQERRSGITLTTIGLGQGNLKDGTLEQLADKGNGNYFYLDSFNEARKVLQTDLTGNMEVVAKDVKLQIEFNPQQVLEYRLVGYDNRRLANRDFDNDAIDAGEIGSGHTVTAIYELVLKSSDAARQLESELRYQKAAAAGETRSDSALSGELAFLKIRFKKPDGNSSELLQYPIQAADVRQDANQTSADFRFAAAVTYFGQLLRQSQFLGEYTMQDVIHLAENAKASDPKGYRQEFVELAKDAAVLIKRR